MDFVIERLNASLGAEITGIDVRYINSQLQQQLRNALNQFQVLIFREQKPDVAVQVAFSKKFGKLVRRISGGFYTQNFQKFWFFLTVFWMEKVRKQTRPTQVSIGTQI